MFPDVVQPHLEVSERLEHDLLRRKGVDYLMDCGWYPDRDLASDVGKRRYKRRRVSPIALIPGPMG